MQQSWQSVAHAEHAVSQHEGAAFLATEQHPDFASGHAPESLWR
ncbi:hypothetical protein FTUN_5906 [Frigoriglobus tundricola]|uniref:Uncharacterized protein n=1 Tax=Frigoriglobus tundricola TaxID=2774151 RepID=A0A6M5YWK7_9BACT|nr:hypothetical protein FTUN_5906 [Frigoriglobus tundricola]